MFYSLFSHHFADLSAFSFSLIPKSLMIFFFLGGGGGGHITTSISCVSIIQKWAGLLLILALLESKAIY